MKEYRPTSPGQRFRIGNSFDEITKDTPERGLIEIFKKKCGRDNRGRISVRHQGGGNKRFYRLIDFKRNKDNVPAKVAGIEYDPNRNARIALLEYQDGEKRYILAPLGLKPGDAIASGEDVEIKIGNTLPLNNIPLGTTIHNVELSVGRGGQMARSAGAAIVLAAKEGKYAVLKMPSGELRRIFLGCRATIGQIGNVDANRERLGKAGRSRHLGRRPRVRGVAMNPCDHPHGGGEGKAPIGMPGPKTPWGKPATRKTRKKRKTSSKFILRRRG